MSNIKINSYNENEIDEIIALCPFGAIEQNTRGLEINAGCKMCRICLKKRPDIFTLIEKQREKVNKKDWQGIAVFIEQFKGKIHPVAFELIGKAKELAQKTNQQVICLFPGSQLTEAARQLLQYGIDKVFTYDYPQLEDFNIDPYSAIFEDFIFKQKPSTILVGGTDIGRSLAPRVAARFRTGLTADCTVLDIQKNTDLDQIRPAYGGNIMAHIHTPNHRPQFATVRYKIFSAPEKVAPHGKIIACKISPEKLSARIEILKIEEKKKVKHIEETEVLLVAGKAFKKEADLKMIYDLADNLNAMVACTRPLIEQGWFDPRLQIGLSGRTVQPKLIITCGVSGSVQFAAGMQNSANIIAINTDTKAPIFNIAHVAIHGDIYEILPSLLQRIEKEKKSA